MSWKPAVRVAGEGDKWLYNALVFATKEEAIDNARDLMSRWMRVTDYGATESSDPVNYLWTDRGLVAVNAGEGEV
jgi:hypothetical protein